MSRSPIISDFIQDEVTKDGSVAKLTTKLGKILILEHLKAKYEARGGSLDYLYFYSWRMDKNLVVKTMSTLNNLKPGAKLGILVFGAKDHIHSHDFPILLQKVGNKIHCLISDSVGHGVDVREVSDTHREFVQMLNFAFKNPKITIITQRRQNSSNGCGIFSIFDIKSLFKTAESLPQIIAKGKSCSYKSCYPARRLPNTDLLITIPVDFLRPTQWKEKEFEEYFEKNAEGLLIKQDGSSQSAMRYIKKHQELVESVTDSGKKWSSRRNVNGTKRMIKWSNLIKDFIFAKSQEELDEIFEKRSLLNLTDESARKIGVINSEAEDLPDVLPAASRAGKLLPDGNCCVVQ
jgi:hypothetical protein